MSALRHSNDIVTEEYQIFDPFTRVELEYLTLGGILKTKQFYLPHTFQLVDIFTSNLTLICFL